MGDSCKCKCFGLLSLFWVFIILPLSFSFLLLLFFLVHRLEQFYRALYSTSFCLCVSIIAYSSCIFSILLCILFPSSFSADTREPFFSFGIGSSGSGVPFHTHGGGRRREREREREKERERERGIHLT